MFIFTFCLIAFYLSTYEHISMETIMQFQSGSDYGEGSAVEVFFYEFFDLFIFSFEFPDKVLVFEILESSNRTLD